MLLGKWTVSAHVDSSGDIEAHVLPVFRRDLKDADKAELLRTLQLAVVNYVECERRMLGKVEMLKETEDLLDKLASAAEEWRKGNV
jgi:hypothetical protein